MYGELYEIWKNELQNLELERLSPDFYERIAEYLKKLKEEGRMLDKRTAKARLLKKETENAKRMLREVIRARYRKLMKKASEGEKVQSDVLNAEEEKLLTGISPLAEAYHAFAENLLRGQLTRVHVERTHKNAFLRFVKEVPAIIGADMKPYGPFKAEDVASLPNENAKILIKQGLAEKIETD
jgi:DNA replication factor GINS